MKDWIISNWNRRNMFQKNSDACTVPEMKHFNRLIKHLTYYGINPYQTDRFSNTIIFVIFFSSCTFFCPMVIHLFSALKEKDYESLIEDMPLIITGVASLMKLMNIRSNKMRFKLLLEYVAKEWKQMETKTETYILNKFTSQGNKLAAMYKHTLISFLILFLSIPLINPLKDIFIPLNETRPRHHIFQVDYVILDELEYFYAVYIHLSAAATFVVLMIITADSLYIAIIHHASGIFAICGHKVQQATINSSIDKIDGKKNRNRYEEFEQCVHIHYEAILFCDTLNECCRNLYLIEIGLNILTISMTAVEAVIYFNRPEEFVRVLLFLLAQNFHLYIISVPGQELLDQSSELGNKIYASDWYQIPVNIQRLLYTMQIRCNRPCILTAGGLYDMTMESFGMTVKACVSYITMFLSLME